MHRRYPQKDRFIAYERGINVVDNILTIQHAQRLQNFEYDGTTLRRRKPFIAKSTIDWNMPGDYGDGDETPAEFVGVHEYIDAAGTSRILHAHTNGTLKEFVSSSSSVNRSSGLTANQRIRFANFMGRCVMVNGIDRPFCADGAIYREFGAPRFINMNAPTYGAGSLSVTRQAIVVGAIRDGVHWVLSDWSSPVTATPSGQGINWSWVASSDPRVDYYQIYVTKNGLGDPFFLLAGTASTSYLDNIPDADLDEEISDIRYRNGPSPVARLVAASGQRIAMAGLVDSLNPDADKTVWLSTLAINKYEIEYFPQDGIHYFILPGYGPVTACHGVSLQDESENANDLFLAQRESCYLLRGTDPFALNGLETVSKQVGVVNHEAFAQWGRHFFFVSLRGLEFLGPSGSPINISKNVQPYFRGGGELNLGGIQGDIYVHLSVDTARNQLLINLRDDTGRNWGNVTLVMDLETFDAYAQDPGKTARFTTWTGPGMAMYLPLQDRTLLLFDNQNYRMLQRGEGSQDLIAGTDTNIPCIAWSHQLIGEFLDFRKKLCFIDVIAFANNNTVLQVQSDSSYENYTVMQELTVKLWNKTWDKTWYAGRYFKGSVPAALIGTYFQLRHTIDVGGPYYVLIGYVIFYTQIHSKNLARR